MADLTLYVIAGPNGIGKTTSVFDLIPAGIPVINSDEIAKQVSLAGIVNVNTQEYGNREAIRLMNEHIEKKLSFAIETNLADDDTWKFLIGIEKQGYAVHLLFLYTDDVSLLIKRIEERHKRGEHYVRPDIVIQRYETSLKLLSHYFDVPDKVQLIDNSDDTIRIAERNKDGFMIMSKTIPEWAETIIKYQSTRNTQKEKTIDLSINEIKLKYEEMRKKKS